MARRLLAAFLLAGALAGVAAAPSGALTKKGGCDLVTESGIEEIFGVAPTSTTEDGQKGKYTTCTWLITTSDGVEATVFIGIDKPSAPAKQDFKDRKASPTAEKVPGIKKGFIDGITVTFIKNGNFVNVQYLGPTPEDTDTEGLTELATQLYDDL